MENKFDSFAIWENFNKSRLSKTKKAKMITEAFSSVTYLEELLCLLTCDVETKKTPQSVDSSEFKEMADSMGWGDGDYDIDEFVEWAVKNRNEKVEKIKFEFDGMSETYCCSFDMNGENYELY